MESHYSTYNLDTSVERLDEIIAAADASFEEVNEIPSRDKLTFTNGFYVNCTALFADIRDSSKLPEIHTRPKLARLYRAFISEVVAIINGNVYCAEVNIVGDCVSGLFNTPYKNNIDSVFSTAARISSLVDILNYKLKRADIQEITVGIGISYGRALMIKAGYKGSAINDVVWMGDVVNDASNLSGYANSSWSDKEVMVSESIYINLNEDNQKLLERNPNRGCYHGYVINIGMNEWYENNCKA